MLRFYRKQAGLRQVDVARRLGFTSTDRISHWEKGQALPSLPNLLRLASLYKAPVERLYEEFYQMVTKDINQMTS